VLNLREVTREFRTYINNLITQGDNHWININSVCNFINFIVNWENPILVLSCLHQNWLFNRIVCVPQRTMGIYFSNFPMRFDVLTAVLIKNQVFWHSMHFSW